MHGETYRQLLDAARRPQESPFCPHSTSQITETHQILINKHELDPHDNYCAIIAAFFKDYLSDSFQYCNDCI